MDRRRFLEWSARCSAFGVTMWHSRLASVAHAAPTDFNPQPGTWRTFEITTRVDVLQPGGVSRVWLPIPVVNGEYQQTLGDHWSGNATVMQRVTEGKYGTAMLYAEFASGEPDPIVELTSRVRTQSRAIDWSRKVAADDPATLRKWTEPTALMPTDGIVRQTAEAITKDKATDIDKVKAVYDWILASTYREPKVRGCGVGDIKTMLETQNFGGKCGDINALFVGLLRSVGVPARDLYGIRVAPSAFGYKALGAGSATISKAQHCRTEVFLKDYGWVAMDPADVGKVAREETSEWLTIDHPLVQAVRPKLFGGWEGNWIAFNMGHDVTLPKATSGGPLGFLMYPQAETAGERRDCLDPDTFKYVITSREITG